MTGRDERERQWRAFGKAFTEITVNAIYGSVKVSVQ